MGVGGKKRYLKPEDFTGRKVRSMGPAENPVLESWKASPVVMAFGEVPTRARVGRDRRPDDQHRRLAGGARAVALLHDRRRGRVHRRLLHGQREPALVGPAAEADAGGAREAGAETIQLEKELNWCVDKLTYEKYGTKDPSKPGVYWMTPQESAQLTAALGDGPTRWVKSKMPRRRSSGSIPSARKARSCRARNPPGSSWIEKIDCSKHASKIVIR